MYRALFTLSCAFSAPAALLAQWCATAPPTAAELAFVRDTMALIEVPRGRNEGTSCVPLQANVLRESNGTGGMTQADLNRALTYVNVAFHDGGIEFFWKGPMNTANNSDYFDYDDASGDNDNPYGLVALFTPATDAVNIYFTNTSGGTCGWSYLPSASATTNCIVMSRACALTGSTGTFPHEMGHYLGLLHTFEATEYGPTHPSAENVARTGPQANCLTDGDLLCGTEADPNGTTDVECNYTGGDSDIHGVPYDPPLTNTMSYYPCTSTDGFTDDQMVRTAQGLVQRMSYATYSLDAPPQDVEPPTDLVATHDTIGVRLTWTDNALNELGYLVERSTTSATQGFRQIANGYTDVNDTDFYTTNIASYTTYYYRVKTVNGDCSAYSNVDSVTTGLIYCRPFYLFFCSSSPIDDVLLQGEASVIDNSNSGCSPDEFGNFTNMSATVNAGGTYALSVAPPDTVSFVLMYIQAWGDWNHDGDFDDANETLLPTYTEMAPVFNGTLTIPVDAAGGDTRIRIRVWNQSSGGQVLPCGQRLVGEGEDYTLLVQPLSTPTGGGAMRQGMHLFPDPVTDRLQVGFGDMIPTTVHIMDARGRMVRSIAVNGAPDLVLDVSALPQGMYLLYGSDGRSKSSQRFVKE